MTVHHARLRSRTPRLALLCLFLLLPATLLRADAPPPAAPAKAELPKVELSEAVKALLDAPYLSDAERAAARVHHGVWTDDDLSTPQLRAKAALIGGAWSFPVFNDPAVPVEDRAEATARRGELTEALALLEGATTIRAARIRAEALEALGRFAEADAAAGPAADALSNRAAKDATETTDAVRALWVRARVQGRPAQDYKRMLGLLAGGREKFDRLDYDSLVTEARLLYEKDNRKEAGEAALQALALCPALADAWALLGSMAVDGFNFDAARGVADNLDVFARSILSDDHAASPQAAAIRAGCWLRQNEPTLALSDLAPALTRFPRDRAALALRCASLALLRDTDALRQRLGEFAAISPGSPAALFAVGKTLSEARQYAEAADYLRQASDLQPKWPAPLIELGLLELQSGRDNEAFDALNKVASLDPFNVRASNSLTLLKELLTYERIDSEHFTVRFKPGVDRVMAIEMLPLLEEINTVVCTGPAGLEHQPEHKTVIELLPDHEWFAVRITGMPDIHTVAASTGPVIAMEAPKNGPGHLMGEYDWSRVVRHEYTHTVNLSKTHNRIPHWFTEACAVHYENGPVEYDTAQLLQQALTHDALFNMRDINIAFVLPKKPTDRSQAYAQGHHMYEFMLERFGAHTPLDLMELYGEGVREDEAMRKALGVPSEEFLASFKVWMRERLASWGMLPSPPIDSIMLEATLATDEGLAAAKTLLDGIAERFAGLVTGGAAAEPEPFTSPEVTAAMLDELAARYPDHPDVLEIRVRFALKRSGGEPTPEMLPLLEKYAQARPVDPLPHKLLARLYMASSAETEDKAIPHLEYLDAREQYSPAYAAELARRYAAQRRMEPAFAKAERATHIAPFNAAMRELAATIALVKGDLPAAERHVAALTVLEPDREVHKQRLEKIREKIAAAGK